MDHHHHHHHHQTKNKKVLLLAFIFTTAFALLEVVSGVLFQTLALLSEGIHMLSDGISLLLSLIAATIGMKMATKKRPFGYRRAETITALLNGLALLLIPIYVVWEAIHRLMEPRTIMSKNMLIIAVIGLLINLLVAFVLSRGDKEQNLNLKSAYLHVFADLLSSVGTIVTALCIYFFQWVFLDATVSIIVSIVIFSGGVHIVKASMNILMEGLPEDVNTEALETQLLSIKGVEELTQCKLWSITAGENYMILHVKISEEADPRLVRKQIHEISHTCDLHETVEFV